MQLSERLEICLLALASRYPDHVVEINEVVLGPQPLGAEGWTAHDMIELLRHTQPVLLDTQADLIINTQESTIYLTEYSAQTPALHVHCRGKLPTLKGNVETRRQALKQPHTVLR
ncbi:MAG: hypothetical protein JO011_20140 [Ktedonobacteraceae bacterium]|nr:hypothetical protein [Ktedonobacteraceae bacterium]